MSTSVLNFRSQRLRVQLYTEDEDKRHIARRYLLLYTRPVHTEVGEIPESTGKHKAHWALLAPKL